MEKLKVKNMVSSRGNDIPNQFIIRTDKGCYFQSYNTVICFIDNDNNVFLDENKWDYSTTTGKYRNQFLSETIKETRENIKNGTYKLVELSS